MYEVRFTGFKTKLAAQEFAKWYEGQGEQDSEYWMTEHADCSAYVEKIEEPFTDVRLVFVRIK